MSSGSRRCCHQPPRPHAGGGDRGEHGPFFEFKDKVRDPHLGWTYDVAVESGKCIMKGPPTRNPANSADFAFGTGRNAFTYMSGISEDEWIDLRISYIHPRRRSGISHRCRNPETASSR